jgi:hypothetical protein
MLVSRLEPRLCAAPLHVLQVLGLGGKMMLDYEPDTRAPHLNLCEEDYLDFDGGWREGGSGRGGDRAVAVGQGRWMAGRAMTARGQLPCTPPAQCVPLPCPAGG